MKFIRSFAHFWYDFIVGDDWVVAVGVVVAFTLTALLAHYHLTAWYVMPLSAAGLLLHSVTRAIRRQRDGGS